LSLPDALPICENEAREAFIIKIAFCPGHGPDIVEFQKQPMLPFIDDGRIMQPQGLLVTVKIRQRYKEAELLPVRNKAARGRGGLIHIVDGAKEHVRDGWAVKWRLKPSGAQKHRNLAPQFRIG